MADAAENLALCSPTLSIPDETLLAAVTTAAYRGVRVELFTSEKADQFVGGPRPGAPDYQALLEVGVVIHRYRSPEALHTKFMLVDRRPCWLLQHGHALMGLKRPDQPARVRAGRYGGPPGEARADLPEASTVLTAEQRRRPRETPTAPPPPPR
ncbi:phospholipase D-like domain-containing protein [Kocuria rhizophila]|nr:phospholipase D-like domain-containing protein [Kocuria rhizophila]